MFKLTSLYSRKTAQISLRGAARVPNVSVADLQCGRPEVVTFIKKAAYLLLMLMRIKLHRYSSVSTHAHIVYSGVSCKYGTFLCV